MQKKKILVIFKDDSSLLSARKFADIMGRRGFEILLCHSYNKRYNGGELSGRQLSEGLGSHKVAYHMEMRDVADENFLSRFDVVASCKFPTIFELKFILGDWKFSGARPCFLATFPGIDFTPKLGIRVRQYSDILCINGPLDKRAYDRLVPIRVRKNQKTLQFSPFFFREDNLLSVETPKKVAFFSQSIIPETRESRCEVLGTIIDAAKRNPSVQFLFKLRHLEDENRLHTHLENYSYQSLAKDEFSGEVPNNFKFTSEYIGDLLTQIDIGITCASTAGMEALGVGTPTVFYSQYSGAKTEKHYRSFAAFLTNSELEVGREEILSLNFPDANYEWLNENQSTEVMAERVESAIASFNQQSPVLTSKWLKYCPRSIANFVKTFL